MFKSLKGFREFYPDACAQRNHCFRLWRQSARRYGFDEYDAPILEPLELFTEKSGEEIRNQLFEFKDKGDRAVALRPEMTPSLARLVGAKANALKRPIKWFSIGENFRYERMQKGRTRSFYQFNCDILGETGVGADAEVMALAIDSLRAFGLGEGSFVLRLSDRNLWLGLLAARGLNSEQSMAVLGAVDKIERLDREAFLKLLGEALEGASVEAEPLAELIDGFRALDSLEAIRAFLEQEGAAGALSERLEQWEQLLQTLSGLGFDAWLRVDLNIVRGLAYYTGFVFELFQTVGKARALAGGGRYDELVKKLGGPDLPAVGFAIGDVTLCDLLEEQQLLPNYINKPDCWMIAEGEGPRQQMLEAATALRQAGYTVEYPLGPAGNLNKQFKQAGNSGARLALIFGEEESARGLARLRNLADRKEEEIPLVHLAAAVRDWLGDA